MPSDGKSSHCLWQGEIKKKNQHIKFITFIHCILEIHNYMVRKQLLMKGNSCKTNTTIIYIFLNSQKSYINKHYVTAGLTKS
jgi:hypothetical protein